MKIFKNLKQVKNALVKGKRLKWKNSLYDVVFDNVNKELIVVCGSNMYTTGLSIDDLNAVYVEVNK